jgi:hypothetical protein
MSEKPWQQVLDWMAVLSNGGAPFSLRLAVDVFERSIASARLEALSEALSFHSVVTKNESYSYIQVHLSYRVGTDGFLAWDEHGQVLFVEMDFRTRFPFRWLWEESFVFDDIQGDLRGRAFEKIRNTLLFTACEDTRPLSSYLGSYGKSKAMEMYDEMIPAMIRDGVFPCLHDANRNER